VIPRHTRMVGMWGKEEEEIRKYERRKETEREKLFE
jgi:hypothetical protein